VRARRDSVVSEEALALYRASDVIDLHVDSFIWSRVFGYDLRRRHNPGWLGRWCFGHADVPRAIEAGLTGVTWVITTNPARSERARAETFVTNLSELTGMLQSIPERVQIAKTFTDYQAARRAGKQAAFVAVQGGNAVDGDVDALDALGAGLVTRVTLLHLLPSSLGRTSSPLQIGPDTGLTRRGHAYVEALNTKHIFVDLAHISKKGFYDALATHDKSQPVLVTHTGVSAVFDHWRNLDDRQLRAVAATGGTIGVMYHSAFLGDRTFRGTAETVVRHLEHIIETVGEDHASLGSDWDGAIVPPPDLQSCADLPRLVQLMLDRGFRPERIQKVLGLNFLRALRALRG
jgi:membrane dipeptidase